MYKKELSLEDEQLKKCLQCETCVSVVANYSNIANIIIKEEELKESESNKEIVFNDFTDEDDCEMIEYISKQLEIEGTAEEKYSALKQLSAKGSFEGTDFCLGNLKQIISAIYPFYTKSEIEMQMFSNKKRYILSIMNASNKKYVKGYDIDRGNNAIAKFRKDHDEENLHEELQYIFDKFIYPHKQTNRNYERFECPEAREYFNAIICEEAERYSKNIEIKKFFERIEKLNNSSQKIILEYIHNAPKELGKCLAPIMKKQKMSENDLKHLTEFGISSLQGFKKNKASRIEPKDFSRLCRALLVSEDVLQKGKGKIYGNWMNLLDKEGIEAIQKTARENKMFLREVSGINKSKKFVREKIKDIIEMEDNEYKELIQNNPALFEAEDYSLGDFELYDALLNKDEAYVLLDVLEKLESEK